MESCEPETLTLGDYVLIAFIVFVILSFVFHQPMAEFIFRLTR